VKEVNQQETGRYADPNQRIYYRLTVSESFFILINVLPSVRVIKQLQPPVNVRQKDALQNSL